MKLIEKRYILFGLSLSVCLTSVASAQGDPTPPTSDPQPQNKVPQEARQARPRPTTEEISKKVSSGKQLKLKKSNTSGPSEKSKIKEITPPSLSSVYLVDHGASTKIPKLSIIYVPDRLKGKINESLKGKLISWKKFYTRNMSSIQLYPVSIKQARGTEKIKQEELKKFERLGKIIIATHDGGLITVSPEALKPEKEDDK